jgi:hypothetical protein
MIVRRIRIDGGGLELDHPLVFVTQPDDLSVSRVPLITRLGCCISASFCLAPCSEDVGDLLLVWHVIPPRAA